MISEIVDAIIDYYKDDEDIAVDCLMYLKNNVENYAIDYIAEAIDYMGHCVFCGGKLQKYLVKEYHSEIDATEYLTELACPDCDF